MYCTPLDTNSTNPKTIDKVNELKNNETTFLFVCQFQKKVVTHFSVHLIRRDSLYSKYFLACLFYAKTFCRQITITAILACAAAAPSGAFIAPLAAPVAPLVAIPAAIPTLSPGDLQAAAINAKVQAEDQAR